jgi:ketosteroid isomerase-like protein
MSSTDEHEIAALVHEYAFRLDGGDLDGVAELFASAEVHSARLGKVLRGAAEVRTLYDSVIIGADGTPGTMHQLTNVTVRVAGDTASARSYFTVLQVTAQGLHPVLAGEYRDEFARVDGRWRFARREFAPKLLGDLSFHMKR